MELASAAHLPVLVRFNSAPALAVDVAARAGGNLSRSVRETHHALRSTSSECCTHAVQSSTTSTNVIASLGGDSEPLAHPHRPNAIAFTAHPRANTILSCCERLGAWGCPETVLVGGGRAEIACPTSLR